MPERVPPERIVPERIVGTVPAVRVDGPRIDPVPVAVGAGAPVPEGQPQHRMPQTPTGRQLDSGRHMVGHLGRCRRRGRSEQQAHCQQDPCPMLHAITSHPAVANELLDAHYVSAINVPTDKLQVKAGSKHGEASSTRGEARLRTWRGKLLRSTGLGFVAGRRGPAVRFRRQQPTRFVDTACFVDRSRTAEDEVEAVALAVLRILFTSRPLANGAKKVNLCLDALRAGRCGPPGGACTDASVQVYRCSLRLLRPTARRRPDGGSRFSFRQHSVQSAENRERSASPDLPGPRGAAPDGHGAA